MPWALLQSDARAWVLTVELPRPLSAACAHWHLWCARAWCMVLEQELMLSGQEPLLSCPFFSCLHPGAWHMADNPRVFVACQPAWLHQNASLGRNTAPCNLGTGLPAFLCPRSLSPAHLLFHQRREVPQRRVCSAPKQPLRALGGAGACLAARFHPSWPRLAWGFPGAQSSQPG